MTLSDVGRGVPPISARSAFQAATGSPRPNPDPHPEPPHPAPDPDPIPEEVVAPVERTAEVDIEAVHEAPATLAEPEGDSRAAGAGPDE